MDYNKLQTYKVIVIHMYCGFEVVKVSRILPDLLPNHHIMRVKDPIRKIDFNRKVRMGEIEESLYQVIVETNEGIKEYEKYCTNIVPWFCVQWMQSFKQVSPYLVKAAQELYQKTDLIVLPVREEWQGRKGEKSWFCENKRLKGLEEQLSGVLADLSYNNNVEGISINKLLQIAKTKGLW